MTFGTLPIQALGLGHSDPMDRFEMRMTKTDISRGYEVWRESGEQAVFAFLGPFDVIGTIRKLGSSSDRQCQFDCAELFVLACICYFETVHPELLEVVLQEVVSFQWLAKDNPALHMLNNVGRELRTVESLIEAWSKSQESLHRCIVLADLFPAYDLPDADALRKKLSSPKNP